MMLMQKASQAGLDISFPQEYLQKFRQYRKQHSELLPKLGRKRKLPASPNVFSSNCKQGISLANTKVYCCVLKESVERSMCKVCPCHEPEPLEYSLYKRVWTPQMKCPNNKCKRSAEVVENGDSNFDYCKECGTVIHHSRHKH